MPMRGAVQMSIGHIGVIHELTLKIVPQVPVQRTLTEGTIDSLVQQLKSVQAAFLDAKRTGGEDAIAAAIRPLDEMQVRHPSCHFDAILMSGGAANS